MYSHCCKKICPKQILLPLMLAMKLYGSQRKCCHSKYWNSIFTGDFLDETQWTVLPKFDIIISNPPYIPVNEKEKLDINVTAFEPHRALFVPENSPLLFYKKIAEFASIHLNPGGKIFMETHEDFANETAVLFLEQFKTVTIKKDIFGKERMVMAY